MIAELAEPGMPPESIASRLDGKLRAVHPSREILNVLDESYTRKCARRIRLVMVDHFADAELVDFDAVLVQARQSGQLTRQQFDDIRVADIIAQGTPDDGGAAILAVIESSVSINPQDVGNAHRRAGMIQELTGRIAAAFCVSHYRWSDALADTAAALEVTLIHYTLPGFDIP